MDPATLLLILLGGAIIYNNSGKNSEELPESPELMTTLQTDQMAFTENSTTIRPPNDPFCEEFKKVIPADKKYGLLVEDMVGDTYKPNTRYNVFLLSASGEFTKFFITGQTTVDPDSCCTFNNPNAGIFSPVDEKSILSSKYTNTISEMDEDPKREVKTIWISPKKGTGCVFISGIPYMDGVWYSDPESLLKRVCEEPNSE